MKFISQDYFNDSVKENMELLDQSVDEAIEETIEFFRLENVDLSHIVKNMVKYPDGHPCALIVERLRTVSVNSKSDVTELGTILSDMGALCGIDLAHRKYLVNLGVIQALDNVFDYRVNTPKDSDLCLNLLITTTCRLIHGQSDVLQTESGVKFFEKLRLYLSQLLANDITNIVQKSDIVSNLFVLMRASCVKNEANRELISHSSLLTSAIDLLSRFTTNFHVSSHCLIREACGFLRTLTLDDDMSVEFGRGSENARLIASHELAMEAFLNLAKVTLSHTDDKCTADIFMTLATIITREEFCLKFKELNGIDLVFTTLSTHVESLTVTSSCLVLLRMLCGSDLCKRAAASWSASIDSSQAGLTAPRLLVCITEQYLSNSNLVKQAALAIAAITLRQPDLAQKMVSVGIAEVLSKSLQLHFEDSSTVRSICMAIRNCVSRSPELRSAFVGSTETITNTTCQYDPYELEALLNRALSIRDCADEAKAALRDLGCSVQLRELWKGKANPVE